MQFSMKNLSIRTQVLVPVLFTIVALFIALWVTKNNLQEEQALMTDHTQSLIFYKDSLATIDDTVYPLRISAVYAIYDAKRRDTFLVELKQGMQKIEQLLDVIEGRETFRTEAILVGEKIEEYISVSEQAVAFFTRRDQGLVSEQEYNNFIGNYREAGNAMASAINDLSSRVNVVNNAVMVETEQDAIMVQNITMWTILGVLALSLVVAWVLSGMIVTPIQKLQSVMRRISEGDLTVRADADGENEIA
ncbi:MAG TPA: methyl-accepting chemotaxis protein, partial [Vibrio sp.]|nr:methyl-accepting chemotaxis protein [Vibrio sp.]